MPLSLKTPPAHPASMVTARRQCPLWGSRRPRPASDAGSSCRDRPRAGSRGSHLHVFAHIAGAQRANDAGKKPPTLRSALAFVLVCFVGARALRRAQTIRLSCRPSGPFVHKNDAKCAWSVYGSSMPNLPSISNLEFFHKRGICVTDRGHSPTNAAIRVHQMGT